MIGGESSRIEGGSRYALSSVQSAGVTAEYSDAFRKALVMPTIGLRIVRSVRPTILCSSVQTETEGDLILRHASRGVLLPLAGLAVEGAEQELCRT